jgi:hypothetical protein
VEPLGIRATLILALALVLAMLSAGLVLTKIGDNSGHTRCYMHLSTLTCTPDT